MSKRFTGWEPQIRPSEKEQPAARARTWNYDFFEVKMPEVALLAQTTSCKTPRTSRWAIARWWVMLLSSFGVVAYASRFFVAAPATGHFAQYILPLRLHIAGGMGAL